MSDDDEEMETENDASFMDMQKQLLWVLNEEEDVVLPHNAKSSRRQSSHGSSEGRSSSSKCGRRSTIETFLSPLTNFIDFKDDDSSSRSWMSFVEIGP